ncbi:patatin-like phospholipase family protein [Thalassotalea sp. PS06]|uniref:patatin-like phospholipase family protein n=1 Tax=Thalassotalea sp. PS06 TaxID=2594005 RepID=UPI0011644329|nr:patatin-like phospholipase family protein [Thalassotalea sp. PS06]QDP01620.1 patatin-like phospholipase family protein [Thalassotalea sp. PS06]
MTINFRKVSLYLTKFFLLLSFFSGGIFAQVPKVELLEPSNSPNRPSQEYFVAVKGGVSLGSYESGLNWYLVEHINSQPNETLVSFSGASAGSINSVLSAIKICSNINEELHSNLLRSSWNIDISNLNRRNNEGSLFNRESIFLKVVEDLSKYILDPSEFDISRSQLSRQYPDDLAVNPDSDEGDGDCSIITTMSVTLMYPYQEKIKNSDQTTGYQRFVIPVKVITVNGKIAFKNVYLNQFEAALPELLPDYFISLPETPSGFINPDIVFEALKASSSFPVAFAPVELPFCISKKLDNQTCTSDYATTSLFSDGGLFDNAPIGVSVDIHEMYLGQKQSADIKPPLVAQRRIIFIHPDNLRNEHPMTEEAFSMSSTGNIQQPDRVGLWDYLLYLGNSFDTATSANYRKTLEKIHGDEDKYHFRISSRYHNLLADFHAHFGAFYSAHFRVHDYLTGVYDGAYMMSAYACENLSGDNNQACIQQQMIDRVKTLTKDKHHNVSRDELTTDELKDLDNQIYELDFLKYLYNTEFQASMPLTNDYYQNTYIALSQAFYTFSGRDSEPLTFNNYMNNLKGLATKQFKSKSLQEELFIDYPRWAAEHFKVSYDNLIAMQEQASDCYNCEFRIENKTLLTILRISEPIKDSWIDYSKTGTWPLNNGLWDCCSGTLRFGFGALEKSLLLSAVGRIDSPFEKITFDGALTFNYLEADFEHDDYFSVAVGGSYHTGSLFVPVVSTGYEYSFPGRSVYKDPLNALYVSTGLINELITMRAVVRLDEIEDFGEIQTRDKVQIQAQFDLMQLIEMIF